MRRGSGSSPPGPARGRRSSSPWWRLRRGLCSRPRRRRSPPTSIATYGTHAWPRRGSAPTCTPRGRKSWSRSATGRSLRGCLPPQARQRARDEGRAGGRRAARPRGGHGAPARERTAGLAGGDLRLEPARPARGVGDGASRGAPRASRSWSRVDGAPLAVCGGGRAGGMWDSRQDLPRRAALPAAGGGMAGVPVRGTPRLRTGAHCRESGIGIVASLRRGGILQPRHSPLRAGRARADHDRSGTLASAHEPDAPGLAALGPCRAAHRRSGALEPQHLSLVRGLARAVPRRGTIGVVDRLHGQRDVRVCLFSPAAVGRSRVGARRRVRPPRPRRALLARGPAARAPLAGSRRMRTLTLTLRPALPRSLYLETTSRCNSLCETCILTFGGREPQKDLAWTEFRRVVDQFPVLDRVLLHGIGEPLLNRERPRVSLWLTALKDNLDEIPGLVPLAVRTGASAIHLQRLVYNGLGMATEDQSLFGRLEAREAEMIRTAEAAAKAAGIVFSASGAAAPEVSLTAPQADQPWSACRRPWSLVYVTVHGNVLPCCIAGAG